MAISTPIGTAITPARTTITAVPTMSERIPPPAPPNCGGSWMRKLRLSAEAPALITSKVTSASAATATTAAAIAVA